MNTKHKTQTRKLENVKNELFSSNGLNNFLGGGWLNDAVLLAKSLLVIADAKKAGAGAGCSASVSGGLDRIVCIPPSQGL